MVPYAAAQPRRARAAKAPKEVATKPAPAKPAPAEADTATTSTEPASPAASDAAEGDTSPSAEAAESDADLGEPPPATQQGEGGTKLSPLTPNPDEFPEGGPAPPPADFDRLLGDIAALRSRVAALTTTLFKSRLRVIVETRGDEARIESLAVTLDDGVVFSAPERFSAEDERVVYEHAVAPGQHVLGLDVERYDARRREYRSWQASKFSLLVPDGQTVEAHFVLEDDSEMGVDFPEDQDGEYELGVRLRARVVP